MLKKTITYVNPFTEQEVTEDHYFHLSKADLVEMSVEEHAARYTDKDGNELEGMQAHLQRIVESEDAPAILKEFKAILRRAYGKKDGDRFVKSPEIWTEFEGSEAYSELIFDLLTHEEELAKFINAVIPGNLDQIAAEVAARSEAEEARQNGSTSEPHADAVPRVLTRDQAQAMSAQELQAGLADGRYKLA